MNPWVERALLSVAASAVSTAMWVTTAKNPSGSKRRRRGKKKRRGKEAAPDQSPVPRSPGAQAVRDHENGHRDGMSTGEFLENLQRTGARNAARVAQLRAWLKNEPSPSASTQKQKASDRKSGTKSTSDEGAGSALDEVKKAAKKHIHKEVAARTGLSQASEKWQETSASLKHAGGRLSQSVKQKMPDNWGQGLGEAGRNMKDALTQAGQNVRDGLETEGALGEKLDQGIQDLGRWIQGPGAPKRAEVEQEQTSTDRAGDWVEARMPGDPPQNPAHDQERESLRSDEHAREATNAPSSFRSTD